METHFYLFNSFLSVSKMCMSQFFCKDFTENCIKHCSMAIGITRYSMDCLNESHSKSEQNYILQAMFLFYSLMAFLVTIATEKPH